MTKTRSEKILIPLITNLIIFYLKGKDVIILFDLTVQMSIRQ